ncbi:MAG TPA: hypothetical protein DCE41_14355 [Cytophagales bacterium]|nr:hypothetical protein [Cytophagales bacterium]HAA20458.1 hypothetical protein [Cytophagales bacterium]HAP64690.1 hypothetical protein [Cytophagales bacterium]
MEISDKVLELRKAQGMTQQQLADKSGLSLRTIQRIEKGDTQPYGHSLQAIALAFNQSVEYLQGHEAKQWAPSGDALKWMNLSGLLALGIPYAQLVLPIIIYRKHRSNSLVQAYGGRILSFQILWSLVAYGSLLLVGLNHAWLMDTLKLPRGNWILRTYFIMALWHIIQTLRMAIRLQERRYTQVFPHTPTLF